MLRDRRYGGASKASASTVCQKCLKRDNYECKATAQERPYAARPSRTQQLMNPKLVPQLSSDVPNPLTRKNGIADEHLASLAASRGRKRSHSLSQDPESTHAMPISPQRKRPQSVSSSSTTSVSTISTSSSRSRSRTTPRRRLSDQPDRYLTSQRSDMSFAPTYHQRARSHDRKRRRRSTSSYGSSSQDGDHYKGTREPSWDRERNTRRRRGSRSPVLRGRARSRSRSRRRERSRGVGEGDRRRWARRGREEENDGGGRRRGRGMEDEIRRRSDGGNGGAGDGYGTTTRLPPEPRKGRSLSPYSRRLALTQALGRGGE